MSFSYYSKQALFGAGDCVFGMYSTVRHPVVAVQNLGHAVVHPGETAQLLYIQARDNPVRFASNLATGSLLGWFAGGYLGSSTIMVPTRGGASIVITQAASNTTMATSALAVDVAAATGNADPRHNTMRPRG